MYFYTSSLKGTINLFNFSREITRTFPSPSIQITLNCPFLARNYRRVAYANLACVRICWRPTRSRANGPEMNGQRERGGKEAKMNEQRDSSRLPRDAGEKLETNRSPLDSLSSARDNSFSLRKKVKLSRSRVKRKKTFFRNGGRCIRFTCRVILRWLDF